MSKTISYGELKAGDVYRNLHWSDEGYDVNDYDIAFESLLKVELLGKAKRVEIPGLDEQHPAWLFRGKLHVGCQRFSAVKAFKALGKALGYEVTG